MLLLQLPMQILFLTQEAVSGHIGLEPAYRDYIVLILVLLMLVILAVAGLLFYLWYKNSAYEKVKMKV